MPTKIWTSSTRCFEHSEGVMLRTPLNLFTFCYDPSFSLIFLFTFCYDPSFSLIFLIFLYLLYSTTRTLSYLSLSSLVLPFVPYLLYSTTRTLSYLSDSSMFVLVFLYLCALYYINPNRHFFIL